MIVTKQPKAILLNYTQEAMKTLAISFHVRDAGEVIDSFDDIDDEQADKIGGKALKMFHAGPTEFIDTIWIFKNVSRAFQQQLTRTRLASYSIQSLRVVTRKGFATGGHYTMPPKLDPGQKSAYHNSMLQIQDMYNDLLDIGVEAEDARGILPLNVHSDITMKINLNSLYHMLKQRFCVNTQWEFRQIASQMRTAIKENLGEDFAKPMEAPCVGSKRCPMGSEYCGVPVWEMSFEDRSDFYKNHIVKIEAKE